jgi:hypothetical protein
MSAIHDPEETMPATAPVALDRRTLVSRSETRPSALTTEPLGVHFALPEAADGSTLSPQPPAIPELCSLPAGSVQLTRRLKIQGA